MARQHEYENSRIVRKLKLLRRSKKIDSYYTFLLTIMHYPVTAGIRFDFNCHVVMITSWLAAVVPEVRGP